MQWVQQQEQAKGHIHTSRSSNQTTTLHARRNIIQKEDEKSKMRGEKPVRRRILLHRRCSNTAKNHQSAECPLYDRPWPLIDLWWAIVMQYRYVPSKVSYRYRGDDWKIKDNIYYCLWYTLSLSCVSGAHSRTDLVTSKNNVVRNKWMTSVSLHPAAPHTRPASRG